MAIKKAVAGFEIQIESEGEHLLRFTMACPCGSTSILVTQKNFNRLGGGYHRGLLIIKHLSAFNCNCSMREVKPHKPRAKKVAA